MSRKHSELVVDDRIPDLLTRLVDQSTGSIEYAAIMYNLGQEFGKILLGQLNENSRLVLACTVEDADYLAKGILEMLEKQIGSVVLCVFWNKRFKVGNKDGISVAPIVKEYREKGVEQSNVLVIIKSVISSSCVVRTNLTRLIEALNPGQIYIVSPVLLKGATTNLENEFDASVSSKFRYLYFAEDDQRNEDGIVLPGIGGDVYQRLGFQGQEAKNRFIPSIVKERRHRSMK